MVTPDQSARCVAKLATLPLTTITVMIITTWEPSQKTLQWHIKVQPFQQLLKTPLKIHFGMLTVVLTII